MNCTNVDINKLTTKLKTEDKLIIDPKIDVTLNKIYQQALDLINKQVKLENEVQEKFNELKDQNEGYDVENKAKLLNTLIYTFKKYLGSNAIQFNGQELNPLISWIQDKQDDNTFVDNMKQTIKDEYRSLIEMNEGFIKIEDSQLLKDKMNTIKELFVRNNKYKNVLFDQLIGDINKLNRPQKIDFSNKNMNIKSINRAYVENNELKYDVVYEQKGTAEDNYKKELVEATISASDINNGFLYQLGIPIRNDDTNTNEFQLNPDLHKIFNKVLPAFLNEINNPQFMSDDKISQMFYGKDADRVIGTEVTQQEFNNIARSIRQYGFPRKELYEKLGNAILDIAHIKIINKLRYDERKALANQLGAFYLQNLIEHSKDNKIIKVQDTLVNINDKQMVLNKLEFADNYNEEAKERLNNAMSSYSATLQKITNIRFAQPEPIEYYKSIKTSTNVKDAEAYQVSPKIYDFMRKEQNVVYKTNIAYDAIKLLDQTTYLITAGGEDPNEIEHLPVEERESVVGKNNDLLRRMEALKDNEDILSFGSKFKWSEVKNLRTMMDSIVNPQDNKVHRFLVDERGVTYNKNNEVIEKEINTNTYVTKDTANLYKLALSQAFDLDTDKRTDNSLLDEISNNYLDFTFNDKDGSINEVIINDKLKPIINDGSYIDKVVKLSLSKEPTLVKKQKLQDWIKQHQDEYKAYLDFIKGTEHIHAFQALIDIKYLQVSKSNNKSILKLEADAITSGMVLTMLQTIGVTVNTEEEMNKLVNLLAKGGIYVSTDNNTFGLKEPNEEQLAKLNKVLQNTLKSKQLANNAEYLTHGFLKQNFKNFNDFYETLSDSLNDYMQSTTFKPEQQTIVNAFGSSFSRKQVKPFQMVYVYGASFKNIMEKTFYEIAFNPLNKMLYEFGNKGGQLKHLIAKLNKKTDDIDDPKLKLIKQLINNGNDIKEYINIYKWNKELQKNEVINTKDLSEEELLNTNLSNISFKFDSKLVNYIKTLFKETYEPAFEYAFGQYKFIDDYRNTVKSMSNILYETSKEIFNKQLQEEIKKRGYNDINQVNNKELTDIISNLIKQHKYYTIKSIQSTNTHNSFIPLDKFDRNKNGKQLMININGKALSTNLDDKHMVNNAIATPVTTIHQIDSNIIVDTLQTMREASNGKLHIGHIFDALLMPLDLNSVDSISEYNKETIKSNANYSVAQEMMKQINDIYTSEPEVLNNILANNIKDLVNNGVDIDNIKDILSGNIDVDINNDIIKHLYSLKNISNNKELVAKFNLLLDIANYNKLASNSSNIANTRNEFFKKDMVVGHSYLLDPYSIKDKNPLYIHKGRNKIKPTLDPLDSIESIRLDPTTIDSIKESNTNNNKPTLEQLDKIYNNDKYGSSSTEYMGELQDRDTFRSPEEVIDYLNKELPNDIDPIIKDNFINLTSKSFNTLDKINVLNYLNTTFNRGLANIDTNTISLSKSAGLSNQSTSEIYMHELMHLYTGLAFKYSTKLVNQSLRLQQAVKKYIQDNGIDTDTLFIPDGLPHTRELINNSKKLSEYAFNGDPVEFITIASTNSKLKQFIDTNNIKIKHSAKEFKPKNLLEKIISKVFATVENLFNTITSSKRVTSKEINSILNNAVVMTNALRSGKNANDNVLSKIDIPKKYQDVINNKIKSTVTKQIVEPFKKTTLYNEIKDVNVINKISNKISKVNSDFGKLFRDVANEITSTSNKFGDFFPMFTKIKYEQETIRNHINKAIEDVTDNLLKDASEFDKVALSHLVLKTDIYNVYDKASQATDMIIDETKRLNRINELSEEIKLYTDPKTYNAMMNQAQSLGYYIATGSVTEHNLMLNAHNINNLLFDQMRTLPKPSIDLTKQLDEFISLIALHNTDPVYLSSDYISKNKRNINNLVKFAKGLLSKQRKELFTNPTLEVKGFIRPKNTSNYEYITVKANKTNNYKKIGFNQYSEPFTTSLADGSKEELIVLKRLNIYPNYTKGIVEVTNTEHFGSDLYDLDNVSPFRKPALLEKISRNATLSTVNKPFKLFKVDNKNEYAVPLLNDSGTITNYRSGSINKLPIINNRADMSIDSVLANTVSHNTLKINGKAINKLILEQQQKAYEKAKDKSDYMPICKPSVANKLGLKDYNEEFYALLPSYTRQMIGNKVYYINKNLTNQIFGYKDTSITNIPLLKKANPKFVRVLGISEKLLKDLVKLLKFPLVFINSSVVFGNLISNVIELLKIMPLSQIVSEFKNRWNLLNDYQTNQQELNKLKLLQQAGLTSKEDNYKIKVLTQKLNNNPMHDIIDAGLIGSIIDDVTLNNDNNTNLITSKINEHNLIKNKNVKSLLDTIFLTQESLPAKLGLKTTQFTDGIAKSIYYEYYKKQGMSKAQSLELSNELFINYSINESKYLKYLNDTGLFMFSKFLLQTPKALVKSTIQNPIGFLKQLGINIVDQAIPDTLDTYNYNLLDIITNRRINLYQQIEYNINPIDKWSRLF